MSIRETPKGSDENLTASSDSFWEVGNYRRTVKRIDDGAKLCDELMKLILERAEIEAKYSSKLDKWSKKWEEAIKLGPEYNTMESAMKGTVNEANARSQVHIKCKNELIDDVFEFVKKWKMDNYHKSLFQWKETKEAEDGFAKAQKPWAKFLMKVMRAKKAYHAATKSKEQAEKQVSDANNDPNFPPDKLRKLEDLAEKKRDEMEKTKMKYERRIDEITTEHNDTYAEGMTRQFEKCQDFEHRRLEFMKEALMKYYRCLNISEIQKFTDIFVEMSTTFQLASSGRDLEWWAKNHGTSMPHNWPAFEEYDETQSAPKPMQYVADSSVSQLKGYKEINHEPRPPSPPPSYTGVYEYEDDIETNVYDQPNPFSNQEIQQDNQSGQDQWESEPPPLAMDIGVPVRALYDYEQVEEDELTFHAGDILTKLSEVDDQGWCLGRFEGREGLIPADYVEAV